MLDWLVPEPFILDWFLNLPMSCHGSTTATTVRCHGSTTTMPVRFTLIFLGLVALFSRRSVSLRSSRDARSRCALLATLGLAALFLRQ
jgi:hypothetical protein